MGENYTSQSRSVFDWYIPHLYNYLHPLLFYKTFGFFSISFERKSAGVFFTSILRSHKCEIIYTSFHAFMLSSTKSLMWWRKNGKAKKFFYNSCGTLIWVGIIAVKVDRSLILIIRTYITVYILYCSTKTFCFFSISFERRSVGKFFASILR